MNTVDALVDFLKGIDGQGYKAYKGLRGTWAFPDFALHVDHVQGDPFARPSRVRVILSPETAELEDDVLTSRSRRLGVAASLRPRTVRGAIVSYGVKSTIPTRTRWAGWRVTPDSSRAQTT